MGSELTDDIHNHVSVFVSRYLYAFSQQISIIASSHHLTTYLYKRANALTETTNVLMNPTLIV